MKSYNQKPLDNYDVQAWDEYWKQHPGALRSVGAEGDDGGEGDEGGDEGAGGNQADIGKAVADAVAKAMGPMFEAVNTLAKKIDKPEPSREEDDEEGGKGGAGNEEEPDFDLMTNKEIVAHFRGEMVELAKAFAKKLEETAGDGQKTAAQVEADRMGDKHPDFWPLRDQVAAEIKGNPHLTLEQAYKLAKVNNPDKVAEIAKKLKKDSGETEETDEEKELQEKMPYGGLLPTSGRTRPNQKMKPADAANAAWNSVFGGSKAVN